MQSADSIKAEHTQKRELGSVVQKRVDQGRRERVCWKKSFPAIQSTEYQEVLTVV
jgi:hypothetical protein